MNREKTNAPDLDLILGPYKMPLRTFDKGHGYLGALTFDTKGRIQCHFCGLMFDDLSFHVKVHGLTVKTYKAKLQLSANTRLISEGEREKRKMSFLRHWMTLSKIEKEALKKKRQAWMKKANRARDKTRNLSPISLEEKNKRGVCPDQLLHLIREAAKAQGTDTLSKVEFGEHYNTQRFFNPIKRTFGSWNDAVKKAGLKERKNRVFTGKERKKMTNDYLLSMLLSHWEDTGIVPTASDCRRGFLPAYSSYTRRWGSFPLARKAAGIPDWKAQKIMPSDVYKRNAPKTGYKTHVKV